MLGYMRELTFDSHLEIIVYVKFNANDACLEQPLSGSKSKD
jgi:hypothetical protein